MSPTRSARKWTDADVDEKWLESKIPGYQQVMLGAKSGKKNNDKRFYVLEVMSDYEKAFPGHMDNMELKGIGKSSTEQERKVAMYNRFKDWLQNQLRTVAPTNNGKRDELIAYVSRRKEQSINAYYRLFEDRLAPALAESYKTHCTESITNSALPMNRAAFRCKFLANSLKLETEDVQRTVMESRKDSDDGANADLKWEDGAECEDAEIFRHKRADALNRNIGKAFRSLSHLAEEVVKATNWRVTILFGGPDPKRGGDIHTMSINKGHALPCYGDDRGEDFEDFCTDYDSIVNSFTDFCKAGFDVEDRCKLSLGGRPGDATCATSSDPTKETPTNDAPTLTNNSSSELVDIANAHTQLHRSPPRPLLHPSNDEPSNFFSDSGDALSLRVGQPNSGCIGGGGEGHPTTSPAREERQRAGLAIFPKSDERRIPFTNKEINQQQDGVASKSIDDAESGEVPIDANDTPSTDSKRKHARSKTKLQGSTGKENVHLSQTQVIKAAAVEENDVDHRRPTTDGYLVSSENSTTAVVQPRRSGRPRNANKAVGKPASAPASSLWTVDAEVYLRTALGQDLPFRAFKDEIIGKWMELEKKLNFPDSKTKNRLTVSCRPAALSAWNAGPKDFYKIPSNISSCKKLLRQTMQWYRSLQPPSRNFLDSFDTGARPDTIKDAKEWCNLRKGGPQGFFSILLTVSWMPVSSPDYDDHARIEGLLSDISYVLSELVKDAEIATPTELKKRKMLESANDASSSKKAKK